LEHVAVECRDELQEKTDPAVLKLARQCLIRDVLQETRKPFWAKSTEDALVLRMAESYDATGFLMVRGVSLGPHHANVYTPGLVLPLFGCSEADDIQFRMERAD
jgi:hypothetical protein